MGEKYKFHSICADYSCNNNHVFDIESDYDDYHCHDTCVVWNYLTFYGVPFDLLDDKMSSIYEGDYGDAVKIGELFGCLILCRQIIDEGEDPLIICDDIDADLEYTISALSDEDGPLDPENGDPYQDVYYIHQLRMESDYDDVLLKSRIIKELPRLIFKFSHVVPDILAFYSAPLEYTRDPDKEARYEALQSIHSQKISSIFDGIMGEKQKEKDNIVKFGDAYRFTDDEINIVMGRRHSDSAYPEEAKNKDEYAFYEANGFEEVGNSRLLCKYVGRD